MATSNLKFSVYIPPNIHDQLKTFQAEHNIKSLSTAATAILSNYFASIQTEAFAPGAGNVTTEDTTVIDVLAKRIANLEERLVAEEKRSDNVTTRLSVVEEELGKSHSTHTTKVVKSLKPTQQTIKPQSAIYGRGEAASTYPGWELPANISYVLNQFQALNTDEARAAFADKWIGLCTQSLDAACTVCYRLMSIIKEKEMYRIPHWMEGNKTFDSFKDYFEHRFQKPLKAWSELESTHQFAAEACPELLKKLFLTENSIQFTQNGVVNTTVQPNEANRKTSKEPQKKQSQKDKGKAALIQKRKSKPTEESTDLIEKYVQTMSRREVSKFSGLSINQLRGLQKRSQLPKKLSVEGAMYEIDHEGRNCWSVKRLQETERVSESLLRGESQSDPVQIESKSSV